MTVRLRVLHGVAVGAVMMAASLGAFAQGGGAETFVGTATVKTAGAAAATAPIRIVVERKMTQTEADGLLAAFKTGGAPALRKALNGVPVTGSVQLGGGEVMPTRMTLERVTDTGRLLTIVTDKPIVFLGAGLPAAKSKEDYDFGVIDIQFDKAGAGTGTLAPAAKVNATKGGIVVSDYAADTVHLTGVKKIK